MKDLYEDFNSKYCYKNTNILIIGGGSKIISSTMKKLYPQTTSSDNINLQAEGLLNIANKIYK